MRTFACIALGLLLLAPAFAQDSQDEVTEKILKRIDRILDEANDELRRDLIKLVKSEIQDKEEPGKTEPQASGDIDEACKLITAELLKKHLMYLASDELKGRNAGYPGNDKATEYIAEVMKKAGLKPVGDDGTYYQHFDFRRKKTRNCLGLLEGTDPILKKEIVVVGGHHDHVGTADQAYHFGRLGGVRGADRIWNGADDNGSGSTTVLGIIRAFGEGKLRTKRSILFMTFTAEESGLIGSKYYTNNPIKPITDHVFMLNLDMVGRNPEKPVEIKGIGSDSSGLVNTAVTAAVGKTGLKADIQKSAVISGGDSDHSSFRNKNIPFVFFFTGFHADYHRVTDHPDKIAYPNMAKIGQTAARILYAVGNAPERPKFKGGRNFRIPGIEPDPGPRRRLGITVADLTEDEMNDLGLDEDEGGIKVDEVRADTVAEAAGLKEGDVIIRMAGESFPRTGGLRQLRSRIGAAKPKKPVEIVVLRDGKQVKLKVTWDK